MNFIIRLHCSDLMLADEQFSNVKHTSFFSWVFKSNGMYRIVPVHLALLGSSCVAFMFRAYLDSGLKIDPGTQYRLCRGNLCIFL